MALPVELVKVPLAMDTHNFLRHNLFGTTLLSAQLRPNCLQTARRPRAEAYYKNMYIGDDTIEPML